MCEQVLSKENILKNYNDQLVARKAIEETGEMVKEGHGTCAKIECTFCPMQTTKFGCLWLAVDFYEHDKSAKWSDADNERSLAYYEDRYKEVVTNG